MIRRRTVPALLLAASSIAGCGSSDGGSHEADANGQGGGAATGGGGVSGSPSAGSTSVGGASGGRGGALAAAGAGGAGGADGSGGMAPGAGGSSDAAGMPACVADCGSHKWACWPMPNPAGAGLPNPATYTDLGNDAVRDEVTCLEWQQSPPSDSYTWQQALDYCEGLTLGGNDDWRLPTRVEMSSIVDFTRSGAKLDPIFSAGSGFHKTASDWILTINQQGAGTSCNGGAGDCAWAFNLGDGIVSNAFGKSSPARLRCVRGNGNGEAPSAPATPPPNQYTALSLDEVRDNYTGLVWQRPGDPTAGFVSWEAARDHCDALDVGGHAWRLPSIRELSTLVDEAQVHPAINREMFPGTLGRARTNEWYWASHAAAGNTTSHWGINFDDGFTGFDNLTDQATWNDFTAGLVKCVR